MKHRHHIIPKSRGGTDDAWNLIDMEELDHAMQHAIDFVLFEQAPWLHGCWVSILPDDLAEAVRAEMRRRTIERNRAWVKSPETCQKIRDAQLGRPLYWYTNGVENVRRMPGQDPPEGWWRGRSNIPKKCGDWNRGRRLWWTNGTSTKWCAECPGPEWRRGRR